MEQTEEERIKKLEEDVKLLRTCLGALGKAYHISLGEIGKLKGNTLDNEIKDEFSHYIG